MSPSRLRRATSALADPWSLLAAGVGAGTAWALTLPLAGVGGVGLAMLGVAALVGAAHAEPSEPAPARVLHTGTVQHRLVSTLESYVADLERLTGADLPAALAVPAADASSAANSARRVAVEVAGSVDGLDAALARAGQVVEQMTAVDRVAGPVERMLSRRQELLGKLTSAVDGVGELYTKLLELSATTDLPLDVALGSGPDPVSDLNESLDAIRGAFTDLAVAARNTAERLDSPGRP